MIRLGKRVEYGLTALLHLHKNPQPGLVNTHQLSDLYAIPEEHLGKVLQKLAKAGYLEAVHGAHGGYRLGKSIQSISVGDLIEAVEGRKPAVSPSSEPAPVFACEALEDEHAECEGSCTCYAKRVVESARRNLSEHLYHLTLDKLTPVGGRSRRPSEADRPLAAGKR